MKLYGKLFLLLLSVVIFSSCKAKYSKFTTSFFGTFDTVIQVTAYAKNQTEFDKLEKMAESRFNSLNQLFDIYNTYDGINNIKTINDNAGIKPMEVSQEIIDMLELSKEWHKKSNGKVNVVFGSVLSIWHRYRDIADMESMDNEIPSLEELTEANQYTDIEDLIIDREKSTVFLKDPKMRLDVGSVAKGYSTELVAKELTEAGYPSFALSAGGNVRVGGKPMDDARETWVIGIQNPDEEMSLDANSDLLDKVYVNDISVVTSGDYQRYFYSGGVKYHHIIDPDTLQPGRYYRAVTVITKNSGMADLLSTVLFLLPYEEAVEFVNTLDDVEVIFVLEDNTVKTTDGMSKYMR